MKKHYATHVEDTDKLISVAGPILEYETWYEQYKKLMEEQALCSDGRVYSDDWSEMLVSEEQPIASSNKHLMIGSNGNYFTKIALKNLAIYNHILSKDDCIKAYDYLQTLKAK